MTNENNNMGNDAEDDSSYGIDDELANRLDNLAATWASTFTKGLPLPRIGLAYLDWMTNLMLSPGRQMQIMDRSMQAWARLAVDTFEHKDAFTDRRYKDATWQRQPFAWLARAAMEREEIFKLATKPLPGMSKHNADLVSFYTDQLTTALSPNNFPLTNPEVWKKTREERGLNLLRGARQAFLDVRANLQGKSTGNEGFKVGENLAATPGKIVFRNELMELIQYEPTTEKTYAEPILMVPAWIMKYYILDLSEHNSMVRWLVSQGHTVFMISWKNPAREDNGLAMDDYRKLGVMAALDAVTTIVPRHKVHAVGYCVGGTLLSITLAAMAQSNDNRIKSATLFAAQTDFEDAGELKLFVDEMALYWLDQQMQRKGYLDSSQMGGAFSMLRAQPLIWNPLIKQYFKGEPSSDFDIMAWNSDGTRMPRRMHIDYLTDLYLHNKLAQGKYEIGGKVVSMGDVSLPMFVVGTTTDHVAPWKSVYKIRNLKLRSDTTFALTNGGHNAGVVSEPGRARRHYQIGDWRIQSNYQSADEWQAQAEQHEGSWWPAWQEWLVKHSSKTLVTPPKMGDSEAGYNVLGHAPGTYVLEK